MPDRLQPIVLVPELLDEVRDFECGTEPHQQELAAWLLHDAVPALRRGTKVWLFANQANDIVGFGSLGLTRWNYPDADSPKTGLVIIPAVAIRRIFWGKPEGAWEHRYSTQIMQHLVAEAFAWPGSLPAAGLLVHPLNQAAVKLYERFGFQPFHHTYTDPASTVTYQSMIRLLLRG